MAVAALASYWTCSSAWAAAQWDIRPFLDVGATSDDNILLTTGPHESTSGYVAAGRLQATRKTETSNATVNGYVGRTDYRSGNVQDKTEQRAALNAENRTSERGTLGLDGEYRRESLYETIIVQQGTGDIRDVDIGLTTSTQVRRNYLAMQPWWNWLLTERSAVRLGYRFTDSSFKNDAGTGLVDYREDFFTGSYSRQITPKDDVVFTANMASYRPEGVNNDADTVQFLGGFGRRFTENVRGTFALGTSRTETNTAGGEQRTSGLVMSASLRQKSELSEFEGVISRDVTPSGAGALRSDQFRIWWSRRLSEETEFVLDGQYIRNEALEGNDPSVNRRYYEVAPQLRWRWFENVSIAGTVRHRKQKYDTQPGTADSTAYFLGITLGL